MHCTRNRSRSYLQRLANNNFLFLRLTMYKYLWLIFLFTRVSALSAASLSHQPSCVIAQEAPCSFVNDTVNVIGGNFCLQFHHLKVPGHVPLDLVQYYNNKSSYSSWVGTGMTLNYGFLIQGKSSAGKKQDKYDKYAAFNVELPGGSIVPCIAKSKGYGASYYHLDPEVVHDSFTNCGSGQMSARNNLKNIEMKEVIKSSICKGPGSAIMRFAFTKWSTCIVPFKSTESIQPRDCNKNRIIAEPGPLQSPALYTRIA